MALGLAVGNAAQDAARRTALRRMRMLAVALLVLAAVVYVLTIHGDGWLGYVNTGAEAAMVGAVADWFAVVALFKRPLGLPIPHTALIPQRKDDLGRSLETFVAENFLGEDVIRGRLAVADLARKAGEWLSREDSARLVVREGSVLVGNGLSRLRDADVEALVRDVLLPRLVDEPLSPLVGNLLAEIVGDGAHRGVVDLAVEELAEWLAEHRDTFTRVVVERAPAWTPAPIDGAVARWLHKKVIALLIEIRDDPAHRVRDALDSLLLDVAEDLRRDPDVQRRFEQLKARVLANPEVASTSVSLWNAVRRVLVDALADQEGPLPTRLRAEVVALGERLVADDVLRRRVDRQLADLVVFVTDRYGGELTAVITHTIQRWDGREASRRIELYVGKDLQFVRINGTVVGGLVGVLIHAATVALS